MSIVDFLAEKNVTALRNAIKREGVFDPDDVIGPWDTLTTEDQNRARRLAEELIKLIPQLNELNPFATVEKQIQE